MGEGSLPGICGSSAWFSKAGLDIGDGDGLAGPQLFGDVAAALVGSEQSQRQAACRPGGYLPRPSLEEVDNVCKTYKHTAGLGHDCINRRSGRTKTMRLFLGCQGKACDRAAWAHSIIGAAAVGGFLVTRSGKVLRARWARPPLGRRPENQFSHATFGLFVRFKRRLAFSRGRQVRHFSFLGLGNHSSRLQWGHNGGKTHAGNPSGNSGNTPPDLQALERGGRHFGRSPKMVQVHTAEAGRLLVEGLQARDLPLSKGKSKVLIDGPDKLKHALLQQLEVLGIDECGTARNVGADLQLGTRRRALVVKGRLARAAKRTKRARSTHSPSCSLFGSNAGVL